MNTSPLHDPLAAEYVLGTLQGGARTRFVQRLRDDAVLEAQVAYWERALMPMAAHLSAVPSPQVWMAIAERIAPRQSVVAKPGWVERWFGVRTLAPLAAGLLVGVALTVNGPRLIEGSGVDRADGADTQLPESYVGVLAGANGRAGLIVSSRRHGTLMDIKQVQPVAVGAGQTLFLWAIEADGSTRAIGAVPSGKFVQVALPKTSEQLFAKATELAVSLEAVGAAPAAPGGPFVYRGLCGKLWRVGPPKN